MTTATTPSLKRKDPRIYDTGRCNGLCETPAFAAKGYKKGHRTRYMDKSIQWGFCRNCDYSLPYIRNCECCNRRVAMRVKRSHYKYRPFA